MRESDIIYQNGHAWVYADKKRRAYVVMIDGNVCATTDSVYALDDDGLSIVKARIDYLARGNNKKTKDDVCHRPISSPAPAAKSAD